MSLLALNAVDGLTPVLAPLAGAALVIVLLMWRRLRPAGVLRDALVLTLATAAILSGAWWWRYARQRDVLDHSAEFAAEDLQLRADRVQADFGILLDTMDLPLQQAPESPRGSHLGASEAFALLDRIEAASSWLVEGRGLSVYDADGSPLAWKGASYPVPPEVLAGLAGRRRPQGDKG